MKKEIDLITIILPRGNGKEVLELANQKGVIGGFVGLGEGTANKEIMEKFGTTDLVRDVVSLVAPMDMAKIVLELAAKKFGIGMPNHGIAFSTNVADVNNETSDVEDEDALKIITSIVQKGNASKVMEAAREAGAKGGTIVKQDTTGEEHTDEDVILIITKSECYKAIMSNIRKVTENDKKKSVVYVQDAHFVYGLK